MYQDPNMLASIRKVEAAREEKKRGWRGRATPSPLFPNTVENRAVISPPAAA